MPDFTDSRSSLRHCFNFPILIVKNLNVSLFQVSFPFLGVFLLLLANIDPQIDFGAAVLLTHPFPIRFMVFG